MKHEDHVIKLAQSLVHEDDHAPDALICYNSQPLITTTKTHCITLLTTYSIIVQDESVLIFMEVVQGALRNTIFDLN